MLWTCELHRVKGTEERKLEVMTLRVELNNIWAKLQLHNKKEQPEKDE